jgi:hypothetical protein
MRPLELTDTVPDPHAARTSTENAATNVAEMLRAQVTGT